MRAQVDGLSLPLTTAGCGARAFTFFRPVPGLRTLTVPDPALTRWAISFALRAHGQASAWLLPGSLDYCCWRSDDVVLRLWCAQLTRKSHKSRSGDRRSRERRSPDRPGKTSAALVP